jgi:uncharacterized repeat protein (TIGR02543 family)
VPAPKYALAVSVEGAGEVSKSPDSAKYANGTKVTLTATPDSGYEFMEWRGSDTTGAANPFTVTMNGDKTLTAVFLKPDPEVKYTLTAGVSSSGGGAASKSPDSEEYAQGVSVTVTAIPDSGYEFKGWSGDAAGTANPVIVVMSGNKAVTANFGRPEAVRYALTATAAPADGGSVSKSPDSASYAQGATVTLTATPASGYVFKEWSGGATGTANPLSIVMDGIKAVTANFERQVVVEPPSDGGPPAAWDPSFSCPANISAGGLDLTKDNLGLAEHYAIVKFNNGAAPTVTYSTDAANVGNAHEVSGEHVKLTVSYFYGNSSVELRIIVSGTAKNGSLWVEDMNELGYRKTLYLNGADITNLTGSAINIQSKKRTDVHLVGSCERKNAINGRGIEGAAGAKSSKGALFSEGSLVFVGSGSLEVRSKERHAIVSDAFVELNGGNVIIYESAGDGIHANERIVVSSGSLQIKCVGDAIQNERAYPIAIVGGKVTIRTTGTKGHGIVSDSGDIVISDSVSRPDVDISLVGNGSKGLRSHGKVTVNGGGITLVAYGARESVADDTSSAAGIKADGNVEIKKGTLTVKVKRANENGKGINVDGNVTVSGGTTDIESDGDGVKVRGSFSISAGNLKARSTHKKDIDCGGTITKTGTGVLDAPNTNK